MRILLISDIHANLTAFEAVLADAEGQWDKIWCLGDVIGYGPDPNECVALLRQHDHLCLIGNHDHAGLGSIDISQFNPDAKAAMEWTQRMISAETRDYLQALTSLRTEGDFTLAHASPRNPVWEYIIEFLDAWENFNHFETPWCLVGHTHVPVAFELHEAHGVLTHFPNYNEPLDLTDRRFIINPGSVGQPRDNDPRAAYAFLDLEANTFQHKRVPYAIEDTQMRMIKQQLPPRLVARLEKGR